MGYGASKLPAADWPRREISLQTGHAVNYGGSLVQDIRLGGGVPVLVGAANLVRESDLLGAISERTAGVFFVQSHHAVQQGMLALARVIELAHSCDVPVLLDAAAEEDPRRYAAMGVDLVTYSGGKAFEGPTSGFILGRADLIAACRLQESGLARGMKVGKETIAGLLVAMERYLARDDASERARQTGLIEQLQVGFAGLPHTRQAVVPDETSRTASVLVSADTAPGDERSARHDNLRREGLVPLRGVIFDFDGTLAHTLPLSGVAFIEAAHRVAGLRLTEAQVRANFGPTEAGMFQRLAPDCWEACHDAYLAIYRREHGAHACEIAGIGPLLASARASGLRVGLVTGKGEPTARFSLDHLGLGPHLETLRYGAAHGAIKPAAIREVLAEWALPAATVAYVGDAASDMHHAREAGVHPLGAAWADGTDAAALHAAGALAVFDRPEALQHWLATHLAEPWR